MERGPVEILVPNKNGRRAVELCLESIRARTVFDPGYRVTVFNSPGDGGDLATLRRYADDGTIDELVESETDLSHGAAVRAMVGLCRGDRAVILDSDTEIVDPEWLDALLRQASGADDVLAVARHRPPIVTEYDGGELISRTFWLQCMMLDVGLYRGVADERDFPDRWFPFDEYPWRHAFTAQEREYGRRKFRIESGGWLADRIHSGDLPMRVVGPPGDLWSRRIVHYSGISRNYFRPEHPEVAPRLAQIERRLNILRGGG